MYEVYLVGDFYTDKYIFEAESEYAIKAYLINDCHNFESWKKNMNHFSIGFPKDLDDFFSSLAS